MSTFDVAPGELADAGTKADGKAQEAQGIQQKVEAANGQVPEKAWGLLGNLTVHHAYTSMLDTLNEHVADMIAGVQKLAEDIKATAEEYRQNECDTEEKFGEIQKELGDSSSSGAVPAGAQTASAPGTVV